MSPRLSSEDVLRPITQLPATRTPDQVTAAVRQFVSLLLKYKAENLANSAAASPLTLIGEAQKHLQHNRVAAPKQLLDAELKAAGYYAIAQAPEAPIDSSIFTAPEPPRTLAQDYRGGVFHMAFTREVEGDKGQTKTVYAITSDRALYAAVSDGLGRVALEKRKGPPGALVELVVNDQNSSIPAAAHWAEDYLDGAVVNTATLVEAMRKLILARVSFTTADHATVAAVWALGTYVYTVFQSYPYLWIRSPLPGCGKSTLLDTLQTVGFNASTRYTNPSEAVLFRLPARTGGVLLIDEADNLKKGGKVSSERAGFLVEVLNNGYTKGGMVPRVNMDRGGMIEDFPVFCPKIISGLKDLEGTLEQRSIQILLQKLPGDSAFVPAPLPDVAEQGTQLARPARVWALNHATALDLASRSLEVQEAAASLLDSRLGQQLALPLLAVASLADADNNDRPVTMALMRFFQQQAEGREADAEESTASRLVQVLVGLLGAESEVWVSSSDLLARLILTPGLDWIKTEHNLGKQMATLGFHSRRPQIAGVRKRGYRLTCPLLQDLAGRYLRDLSVCVHFQRERNEGEEVGTSPPTTTQLYSNTGVFPCPLTLPTSKKASGQSNEVGTHNGLKGPYSPIIGEADPDPHDISEDPYSEPVDILEAGRVLLRNPPREERDPGA